MNGAFKEAYQNKIQLCVELDGVSGYPSSFLDEAIGELVYDFSEAVVSEYLRFETKVYKKRVEQVKEETLKQWEKRRNNNDKVVHSSGINSTVWYVDSDGNLSTKVISCQ